MKTSRIVLLLWTALPLFAGDIHLAPLTPMATPAAALAAARAAPKPVRILVAEGRYELDGPLVFTNSDSDVTWEAEPGAHPIFSGGRVIGGWQEAGGGLWKADVPVVREAGWYFESLYVNGRRATRARSPNIGFFNMVSHASAEAFPAGTNDAAAWSRELAFHSFTLKPEAFATFSQITTAEQADAVITVPHTWAVHHYRLKQTHAASRSVLMDGPRQWEVLYYEPDGRCWAENFRAALDAPGEWFLDRGGTLFYRPLSGEDMTKVSVVAPFVKSLVQIDGATNLIFRGLSFEHQDWRLPTNGYGESQAVAGLPGAITTRRSRGITFEDCTIAHVATYAAEFRDGTQDSGLKHSHLYDLGAGGVKIGDFNGGDPRRSPTGHITIDDCIVQHGGRIFPEAVGIIIGHSGDNAIKHCDIGDFYYSAISAGWIWGYGESLAQRNRIENNHLHHLGWGVISDMGGVYLLGPAFGTVVRGNHIHHIASYRYGGWGLYTDEGSTGVLMENNLVHDTSESTFHQHYGYYNTIRNNILAFGRKAQLQRSRAETHLSYIFERNIVVWDPATRLLDGGKYNWDFPEKPPAGYPRTTTIFRDNTYWPVGGPMTSKLADAWTWEEWQRFGRDAGSVMADPKFADVAARNFQLASDSPALKRGFVPWDLALAGVRGEAWRAKAAESVQFPDWETQTKPWPSPPFELPLETFEFTAVGGMSLPRMTLRTENKGEILGVTEEAASPIPVAGTTNGPGKRSLRLVGAPNTQHEYSPHLFINPGWSNGTRTVAFDAMARANADWYFDLRVSEADYVVGPSVTWRNGKLFTGQGGKEPFGELPADQWARFEITATPGTTNWSLRVTAADGHVIGAKDLTCNPAWKTCSFVGWINLVKTNTARYFDNLRITPVDENASRR